MGDHTPLHDLPERWRQENQLDSRYAFTASQCADELERALEREYQSRAVAPDIYAAFACDEHGNYVHWSEQAQRIRARLHEARGESND